MNQIFQTFKILTLTFLLGLTVSVAHAAAGDLDLSFGDDGIATILLYGEAASREDEANFAVADADGNIYLVGSSTGDRSKFAVAKLDVSGNLDTSFGEDGRVLTEFNDGETATAYAAALDSSDRLVVVGDTLDTSSGLSQIVVVRYTSLGELDETFGGGDGWMTIDSGSDSNSARAIIFDASDNIVLAGYSGDNVTAATLLLARLDSDGVLDETFGTDGITLTAISLSIDQVYTLLLDPTSNKIILGGSSDLMSAAQALVARYDSTGQLDSTFNATGYVTFAFDAASADNSILRLKLRSGKIYAAGYTSDGTNKKFALARLTSAGALDTTFGGGDGLVTTDVVSSEDDSISDLYVSASSIVALGKVDDSSDGKLALAQYSPTGVLDTTFGGGDGFTTTDVTGLVPTKAFFVTTSNSLLIGYENASATASGTKDFSVASVDSSGNLDSSFGSAGVSAIDLAEVTDYETDAYDITIDSQGRVVLAGYMDLDGSSNDTDGVVARFTTSGEADEDFNGVGYVMTEVDSLNDSFMAVTTDSSNRVIAAGNHSTSGISEFIVARFGSDGELDSSFGTSSGLTRFDFSTSLSCAATSVVLDGSQRILVAGYSDDDFALARLDSSGQLDTTFSLDGKVTLDFESSQDIAQAVVVDRDGRIIVGGYATTTAGGLDFVLACFDDSGDLCADFGDGGKTVVDLQSVSQDQVYGMARDANGAIYLAGIFNPGTGAQMAVVKFDANGNLDLSFNDDGIALIEIPSDSSTQSSTPYDVAVDASGNIILGGLSCCSSSDSQRPAVVVLDSTGQLNTDFDDDGIWLYDGDDYNTFNTLTVDASNQIYGVLQTSDSLNVYAVVKLTGLTTEEDDSADDESDDALDTDDTVGTEVGTEEESETDTAHDTSDSDNTSDTDSTTLTPAAQNGAAGGGGCTLTTSDASLAHANVMSLGILFLVGFATRSLVLAKIKKDER